MHVGFDVFWLLLISVSTFLTRSQKAAPSEEALTEIFSIAHPSTVTV